ncbi:toprim domain-containing protein [Terrabacter sp. Root181]|uniref:toprim domain-containing protein n=1 Tax=Terrabacter sp. Root181 TaxID=1736484 RepID=UPI0006F2CD0D|nr:toprim domain-containing protein [Terrabacter sp. Root181]
MNGATYHYPDSQGHLRLRKIRFQRTPPPTDDIPFPAEQKSFYMQARKGEGMAWVQPKTLKRKYPAARAYFDSLLYRLPDLLAAVEGSEHGTLYITEGEKDADSIAALGLPGVVAVSHWQGGARQGSGGPTSRQARRLRPWRGGVVVCADADDAGAVTAFRWYGLLTRFGIPSERITVVRAAGPMPLDRGRDVTDHLKDGYTLDDLVPMDLHKLEKFALRVMASNPHPDGSGSPI